MKRLFVWLASVSICAAQAVSIGPFATEDWVDERLQVLTNDFATVPYVEDAVGEVEDKIPDVSGFATKSYVDSVSNAIPDVSGFATKAYVDAVSNSIPDVSGLATKAYVDSVSNAIPDTSMFATVEYVNTTSNNLALLMDDLVSEEELGSSVSNIVPGWALVPIPPVTAEVDPAFTNWLATTNVVIDDNVGTFVSNMVPSWALVPIPPVTVEVDPAFTNWLATTNSATVQYVDGHKWDWSQITNPPSFATVEDATLQMHRVYTDWVFIQEFEDAVEAIAGFDGRLVKASTSDVYINNEDDSIHEHVGTISYNDDSNPTVIYFNEPTEKYSDLYDEFNWKEIAHRQVTTGYCLGTQTNKLLQPAGNYVDKSYVDEHEWDWSTQITNAPSFPTYEDATLYMGSQEYNLSTFPTYSDAMLYLGSEEYNLSIFPTYEDTTLHIGQDYDLSDFPTYADTILYMGSEEYDLNDFPTYADGATLFLGDFEYNLSAFPTYSESTLYLGQYDYDLSVFASYQDVTNTVKAITNVADRIVAGSNEAYVNSSGVYYKHPDSYGLPATLSFNAEGDVQVGAETFPSNYTVVINLPEVTASAAPTIPIYGISADGKWELSTGSGDASTGYINYIGDGASSRVFRITGFTGNNFSIVLDMSILVVPDPNATLTRSTVFATDELATVLYVHDVDKYNAKPDIDYENSALELTWGSGALQKAYLPYYNDPSEFPQASQGAITTNGNGSVNVARVSGNTVSGNDNFVFGNSNSVFGDNVTVFGNGNLVTNSYGAAVLGDASHTVKNSRSSLVSGNGSNDLEDSPYSIITGVGGTRVINSPSSIVLSGGGGSVVNSASSVFLAPSGTSVYDSSHVLIAGNHHNTVSNAAFSVVLGSSAVVTNNLVFIWNGEYSPYSDHGAGTFNVSPVGGIEGFWIGETNLATIIQNAGGGGQPALSPDAIAPAWQQGSYTNGDFVIYNTHLYECTNIWRLDSSRLEADIHS